MRRDKVLQYVETFTEVSRDRRFDDRAIRLGHQATHTGQLPDLRRGATSARISHHVDRVKRFLVDRLALGILNLLGAEFVHHGFCHLVVGTRPDIDNLVVTLAIGYQARSVLVLDLLNLGFRDRQDVGLALRNDHVVQTDRDAGCRRHAETRVHEPVRKDDRLL